MRLVRKSSTVRKWLRHHGLIVINSICLATSKRVNALLELALDVGTILVIGGKNSANARRLLHGAQETPKPAWLSENKKQVPAEIYNFARVDISSSTSTLEFITKEMEDILVHTTINEKSSFNFGLS